MANRNRPAGALARGSVRNLVLTNIADRATQFAIRRLATFVAFERTGVHHGDAFIRAYQAAFSAAYLAAYGVTLIVAYESADANLYNAVQTARIVALRTVVELALPQARVAASRT